jgi:predicted MFS family arabinose efflux permease
VTSMIIGRPARKLSYATLGMIAGGLIMTAALGVRQTFGLFIGPLSHDHGLPVALVAFAIALHNLVWGFTQPFAGAAADRYGAAPVVAFGAIVFALGLAVAGVSTSGAALVLSMGVLVGIGISCTAFGVIMPAVGRAAPPEKRSMAMGLVSAAGSLGQVLLVPVAQGVSEFSGTSIALMVLACCMLAAAPLGVFLDRASGGGAPEPEAAPLPLLTAATQALGHRGYCLLTIGFFTCGFQLAFIATHLPNYLMLCHMPIGSGATALALIGLFNMVGCWGFGWLGGRYRQQNVLGWLYLVRSAAIAAFFLLPKTETSLFIFAATMGVAWLGTVPLTSGLVAKVFGVRNLGTLFGVCFLNHQVGSFLGAWLGGYLFDLTGSYSIVWSATAIAGVVAAILHFAINDKPVTLRAAPGAVPAPA